MKVITGPRQSGKTTKAIELANKHDAHLVVHSYEQKRKIEEGDTYPDVKHKVLTYTQLERDPTLVHERVVLDNVDLILRRRFGVPVFGITLTSNDAHVTTQRDTE